MSNLRTIVLASALALPACGGYSASSNPSVYSAAPTTTGAPATTAASVLQTAMLGGSLGFTAPSGRTVYVFDADLVIMNASTCTVASGCTAAWPPVGPPAGMAIVTPWSTFNRTDGAMQAELAFEGRALYLFAGDTANGQTAGDGINAFGGVWHVARPTSSGTNSSPVLPGY
jgi:predicted lipoprotein with Yx(FWY)xxD motif